jgi:hypothetical protein
LILTLPTSAKPATAHHFTAALSISKYCKDLFVPTRRGHSAENYNFTKSFEAIRIFIWPRESVIGAKSVQDFAVAVCELSGQMLIYNWEAYDAITEDIVIKAHHDTCNATFENVKKSIIALF